MRTSSLFPELLTAMYNECVERGCFLKRWKIAKIIPIIKPGQENSMDPSKYRLISLLNMGGKMLEKPLSLELTITCTKRPTEGETV